MMKKIREIAQNPILIGLLLFNFVFVSCNRDEIIKDQIEQNISRKSGEEIVKGLFFFQNDISDKIEFISDFKENIKSNKNYYQTIEELKSMSEFSIKYIKKNNPNFLKSFQNAMYSGNYYDINNKMNECVKLLSESLQNSSKYSNSIKYVNKIKDNVKFQKFIKETDLSSNEGKEKLSRFINENPDLQYTGNDVGVPIVWGAVAIVYVAVLAVSMAAALYSVYVKAAYWSLESNPFQNSSENSITKEFAVKEIANYFKNE